MPELELGFSRLIAEQIRFVPGACGICAGLACLVGEGCIDHGEVDLDADGHAIWVVSLVVLADVVERGKPIVLGYEEHLRAPELAGVAEGLLQLDTRVRVGSPDAGRQVFGGGAEGVRGLWNAGTDGGEPLSGKAGQTR